MSSFSYWLWPFIILNIFCFEELFAPRHFPSGITTPFQLFADLLATNNCSGLSTAFYINSLRLRCVVVTSETSLNLQGVWRQSSTHYSPRPQDDGIFGWLKCLGHSGEEWTHWSCRMLNIVLHSCSLLGFRQLSEYFWLTTATTKWKGKTGRWRAKFNRYTLLQASAAV